MSKDTHHTGTADQPQVELPAAVTVVVAELAGAARQGLLALAVGTGLQVLQAMMDEDVTRLVGAKGRHNPERAAVRHGSEPGRVTLGGRRVRVRRPRVRTADGTREVPLPSYQAFASSEWLDQMALERMLAKLSTRRYPSAQGEHRTADADEPARQVPLGEQVGKLLGGHPEGDHEGEVEQQLQRCRGTVRLVWVAPIMRVTP